jgi:hypothetical protein
MQSWVDTNCQQLENVNFYDTKESLVGHGDTDALREIRTRVADTIVNDVVPGMYTTILGCVTNWMRRQNRPIPYPRDLLVIEKRFMQSTQIQPSFRLWAWPLVLRSSFVAFVKEKVWQLAVLPRTVRLLRAQGESGSDIYDITTRWLQKRPGGWDKMDAVSHCVANLDDHMTQWAVAEGTSPDPAYDEVDMATTQKDVARRLGEPQAHEWGDFEVSLQNINRVMWRAYKQQAEEEARVVIDRQHSALEALVQIVKYSKDSNMRETLADLALGFVLNDAVPSFAERLLGISSNKRSQLYSC